MMLIIVSEKIKGTLENIDIFKIMKKAFNF